MRTASNAFRVNLMECYSKGPRASPNGQYYGFFKTGAELRDWFGREGFNVIAKNRGWLNQIQTWLYLDYVKLERNGSIVPYSDIESESEAGKKFQIYDNDVIWFPAGNDGLLQTRAAAAGFNKDKVMF